MSILTVEHSGFCSGVDNAVRLAETAAKEGPVYCIGDLIHNHIVIDGLKKRGMVFVSDPRDIPDGATVILRSHGCTTQEIATVERKGCRIIDATCPFVKKVRSIAAEYSAAGYPILIAGDARHAEVKGILSLCREAYVVSDVRSIDLLDPSKSYVLVSQTTFDKKVLINILKYAKNVINLFAIFDTICYTTTVRQQECRFLSAQVDVVLVLGDAISSNVQKLRAIAEQHCREVYLVQSERDIPVIPQNKNTGIIAGASTPRELIREVINLMSETQNIDEIVVATAADESEINQADNAAQTVAEVATEPEVAAETATADIDENNQDELMSRTSYTRVTEGHIYWCKVVKADEKGVIVAIGTMRKIAGSDDREFVPIAIKKDGMILAEDAVSGDEVYNAADFAEGSIFEARVVPNKEKGFISLSKKAVDEIRAEEEALKAGEFKMVVTEVVAPHGVKGKVGEIEVFVPASQLRIGYVKPEDLEKYKGKELRLRVLDEDDKGDKKRRGRKSIRASQRVILAEEKKAHDDALWATFVEGAIVEGKVMRFRDWGAYVNVNGYDCLVHISEISNRRIAKPGDVLTIGETYQFLIIRVNRAEGKVNLSYKALQKDPYDEFRENVPVGSVIEGTVERIKSYGAFVSIAPGVDGMIHISEISHDYVKDAASVLTVGQKVTVKVVAYGEDDKKRITLSIKQLTPAPEKPAAQAAEAADAEAGEAPASNGEQRIKKFERRKEASGSKPKREKREEAPSQDYVEGSSQYSGFEALANMFSDQDAGADAAEEVAEDAPATDAPADGENE